MKEWVLKHRIELTLGVLVFLVHGYFYNGANWNQNARMNLVFSFVEPGYPEHLSFRIDRFIPDPAQGFNTGDWASANGHYYSSKAPFSMLLAIPPYFPMYYLETWMGMDVSAPKVAVWNTYLLNLWVSVFWVALSTVVLFRYLKELWPDSQRDALITSLVYAFCSLIFPFDTQIWGHPTAAAFVLLGFVSIFRKTKYGDAWGGFWIGSAIATDYLCGTMGLAAVLLLLRFPDRLKRISLFSLGGFLPVAAMLLYHYACFGNFFTSATVYTNPGIMDSSRVGGFFGSPSLVIFFKLLFSLKRGWFIYTPIFLFVLREFFYPPKNGWDARLVFLFCNAVYFFTLSGFIDWTHGSSSGARYLITVLPLWSLCLPRFSQLSKRMQVAFVVAAVISVSNMLVISSVNTMLPNNIDNPWLSDFYGPFFAGKFPVVTWLTHSTKYPTMEEIRVSTFNWGMVFPGWKGLFSLIPLASIVGVGLHTLWHFTQPVVGSDASIIRRKKPKRGMR